MVLNLCTSSDDAMSKLKFSKGNNSIKNVDGVMVLVLCTKPYGPFIFLPRYMKISQRVSKLLSGHDFQTEIFQWAKFSKNVGGVMVLVLCTSYDNA